MADEQLTGERIARGLVELIVDFQQDGAVTLDDDRTFRMKHAVLPHHT